MANECFNYDNIILKACAYKYKPSKYLRIHLGN